MKRAIIVIALVVVILVSAGAVYTIGPFRSVFTITQTTTQYSSSFSQTTSSLPSTCSDAGNSSFALHGTLEVNSESPAFSCVRFYYYGSQPTTINTLSQLQIKGMENNQTIFQGQGYRATSLLSNFTITASPENVTIGGPSNEGEGTIVIYSITAKPGTNGTYALDLGWIGPQMLNCGDEFTLVSGNGIPDYTFEYGCITVTTYSSASGSSSSVTETTPYPAGYVVAVPVGATNSATKATTT